MECKEVEPLTVSECLYGSPHRAEIMSPLCLCGAQLSPPTYLDRHSEEASEERGGCEITGERKRRRGRKPKKKSRRGGEEEEPNPQKKGKGGGLEVMCEYDERNEREEKKKKKS